MIIEYETLAMIQIASIAVAACMTLIMMVVPKSWQGKTLNDVFNGIIFLVVLINIYCLMVMD